MTSAKAIVLGSDGSPARPASRTRAKGSLLLGLGLVLLAASCFLAWQRMQETPKPWTQGFRVVKTYPHDPTAYTQGLIFDNGVFQESTGRRGLSTVRTVEIETGQVLRKTDLPPKFFGEGLALVGDRLIQITWQEGIARIYDRATLKNIGQFEYEGEGWGLVFDGTNLVMSDGSDLLFFRDPETFKEVRRVHVLSKGVPLRDLNELEIVDGEVWANVWKQDYIARIDPLTGKVLGIIDMTGLFDTRSIPDSDAVLNGIAYDPKSKRLFVTGKLWPKLFEIEIVAK